MSLDWETIGGEVADRANPYQVIWQKLQDEYGISKPPSLKEIGLKLARWEQEEAENLMRDKEGVRELLRRIYKDPMVPETKKAYYKNLLLETDPAGLATALALYNGEEKEFAKRFLGEEVVPMATKEIQQMVAQKKYIRILSSGGVIKAIDGRYLEEPVKATEFVSQVGDCTPIPGSGEKVAVGKNPDGTIKWGYIQIYQCKREHPVYLKPVDPNLKVDPLELKHGIEVEMEHTEDYEVAKKIALQHLSEFPYYYTHLLKMEEEMKKLERTMQPILEFVSKIPEAEIRPETMAPFAPKLEPMVTAPSARVEELATIHSSAEITKLAKQNNIRIGSKIKMISDLILKGVSI